jgi:hypothetical protein
MTIVLVAAIVAALGFVAGRATERGHYHERAMNGWRARLLLDAITPAPLTIEGECTDLTNARPLTSFKFMQPRRGAAVAP